MKRKGVLLVCFLTCFICGQGFPHQSTEESEDSTETTESEVVVVVPVTSQRGESIESHETKSRDEDEGSVSESDETMMAEQPTKTHEAESKTAEGGAKSHEVDPKIAEVEPKTHEGVAKIPEELPKSHEEVTNTSEAEPKIAEGDTKIEEGVAKSQEGVAKLAEVDPKIVEGDTKSHEGDAKFSEEPMMADESPSEPEETRSPVFRPKVVDVERMIEAELKESLTEKTEEEEKNKEEDGKEEEGKGTEEDESDEDGAGAKFPKTESLCPARPEEITKIESECAEEYKQWKAMRAKKFAQQTAVEKTTEQTTTTTTTTMPTTRQPETTTETITEVVKLLEIAVDEPEGETTTNEIADQLMESTLPTSLNQDDLMSSTTDDPLEGDEDFPRTELPLTTVSLESFALGRKKRMTRKVIKKRSCYPATCILRKLNLLDSMGQPSIERIQSFAVNMTVDEKTNLEQKAVGCVKEINEAMIDASADIGKKVGCVAQKVITCLNKGLMCPIMKVPQ